MNFQELFTGKDSKLFLGFQAIFLQIAMPSGSALALIDVVVPIVVDIKDRLHLVFKKYPQIMKVDDSVSAFSRVLDDVLYVEDVRAYIHCTLEELGSSEIKTMYMTILLDKNVVIKPEFRHLKDQGLRCLDLMMKSSGMC